MGCWAEAWFRAGPQVSAGQGKPFRPLTAFLALSKDGGGFEILWISSNTIFSVPPSKQLFSLPSGVLDNSGGRILVRKVAGQSGYKGSYANGVQSASLPRWRESFVVSGTPAPPHPAPWEVRTHAGHTRGSRVGSG